MVDIHTKIDTIAVISFPATSLEDNEAVLVSVLVDSREGASFESRMKDASVKAREVALEYGYQNMALTFDFLGGLHGYKYPTAMIEASDVVIGKATNAQYTVAY